jgi:hypothetical protein
MIDLSLDDIKNILLDLYVAQRENAELRARLLQYEQTQSGNLTDRNGEEIE